MFNSSQSQLTFQDDLDLISQPNDYSQLNFNDFTLPSQTQASQSDLGSQVSKRRVLSSFDTILRNDDASRFSRPLSLFPPIAYSLSPSLSVTNNRLIDPFFIVFLAKWLR
jgi:hypothetical protein